MLFSRKIQSHDQEQQRKREEWATNRRTGAAKKQRLPLKQIDSPGGISKEEIDSPTDDINKIKKQLEAKTRECDLLKNRILDNKRLFKVSTKTWLL